MNWWLENFWILLAGMIILVSGTLALVMYCICKRLLKQGRNWRIPKSLKHHQKNEEIYENVINEPPMCLPPLPPRNTAALENTVNYSPQEKEIHETYSTIMKQKVSVPTYIEPISDYDDVDISHLYRKGSF